MFGGRQAYQLCDDSPSGRPDAERLIRYPGKSRDVAPPYFKKYKDAKYFSLLRALVEIE